MSPVRDTQPTAITWTHARANTPLALLAVCGLPPRPIEAIARDWPGAVRAAPEPVIVREGDAA